MANLGLIRELCNERLMTIRELAKRIGRDESSIQSAIRRGSTNSTTIELIAKELKVPAGIFFDGYVAPDSDKLSIENSHLKELLKEKERTIQILMATLSATQST